MTACVTAHNWVNSPSRSGHSSAPSTVKPAKQSRDGLPHVRVAAGELFPVEWVAGHREEVWFVFLKASSNAMKLMNTHTDALLSDYVNNAPANQRTPPKGARNHQNFHYKYKDTSLDFDPQGNKQNPNPPITRNFYKRLIRPGDADYIPRNKLFDGHMKGLTYASNGISTFGKWDNYPKNRVEWDKFFLFEYQDDGYKINRYCTYQSQKPQHRHIITAARYDLVKNMPSRPDVALFSFPPNTSPGKYIIHYIWRGYYDAIDVEIVAGPPIGAPYGIEPKFGNVIPPPAGSPPTPVPPPPPAPTPIKVIAPRYKRVDHCHFRENTLKGQCRGLKGSKLSVPQACIDECNTMSRDECDGVAVVPVRNVAPIYKGFRNLINIPFGSAGCADSLKSDSSVTHVCYPLKARELDTSTVNVGPTSVSNDPEDPIWYGTCFTRTNLPNRGPDFDYGPLIAVEEGTPDWEFSSHCVSCADVAANVARDVTPRWATSSNCFNCDQFGRTPTTQAPKPTPQAPKPTPQAPPAGGNALVIHLPFDNAAPKQLGSNQNVKATLVQGATVGAPFKLGLRALQLPSLGARVDLGNVGITATRITVACWMRFANFERREQYAFTKTRSASMTEHTWLIGTGLIASEQRVRGALRLASGVVELRDRTTVIAPNTWVHGAITYDGEFVRVWADGVSVNARRLPGESVAVAGDEPVRIGENMVGSVDDVRVYTSMQDVKRIMQGV